MNLIPVITLHRPWPALIALGLKTIETRRHNRFARLAGQWVIIHAAIKHEYDTPAGIAARFRKLTTWYEKSHEANEACFAVNRSGAMICAVHIESSRPLFAHDSNAALFDCSGGGLHGLIIDRVELIPETPMATGRQGIWYTDHFAALAAVERGIAIETPCGTAAERT